LDVGSMTPHGSVIDDYRGAKMISDVQL
jgi:hypothetical protein